MYGGSHLLHYRDTLNDNHDNIGRIEKGEVPIVLRADNFLGKT